MIAVIGYAHSEQFAWIRTSDRAEAKRWLLEQEDKATTRAERDAIRTSARVYTNTEARKIRDKNGVCIYRVKK